MLKIKTKFKQNNGFTLLELMVVITIIGLLVAIIAPNILSSQDKAMKQKAIADISNLEQALDLYRLDNYRYPTTEQGLIALVEKPTVEPIPKNYNDAGYIRRLPQDPWGNDYVYELKGGNKVRIISLGADGKIGGTDNNADIELK